MHGPVASSWVGRLPKFIVVAANIGYTPGNVHFSVRTRRPNENLLDRLRAFREVTGAPELGQGHKEATGGVLPIASFQKLLAALGFDPVVAVAAP
jgi:single-stranded-DNA-specific exonuclease